MKKVLALVLVAILAIGMSTMTFAAVPKVNSTNPWSNLTNGTATWPATLSDGYGTITYGTSSFGKAAYGPEPVNQTVTYSKNIVPFDKVKDYINLYSDMFNWDNLAAGTTVPSNTLLTAANIRDSKFAVRTSVGAGSKAVDSVAIDTKIGAITIKYVTEWVSVKDLDFEFTVYLTVNGKRQDNQGLTFVGTLANDITEVYENDDYVDTSAGVIAHAQEFVPKIEVDLGNGISIHTKFFKDKKYYGTSTRDSDEADDVVFSKYPDVDNVVTLKTVGLNSTGDIVKMSTDYSDYYVYDADLNYLGRASEMLPYSAKYYLANRELNVTGDIDDEISEPEVSPTPGGTTGGNNPNTGADGMINVAVVAAVMSLAAAGAVSLKKK